MAKKAKATTVEIQDTEFDDVFLTFGHPVSIIEDLERTVIPWSPAYDQCLGGGVVSGGMVNLAGMEKLGKTSSLLHLLRNCQKPEHGGRYWNKQAATERGDRPGRPVVYVNVEGRLTKRDIRSIPGMDYSKDKFRIITTTATNVMYAQNFFADLQRLIEKVPGVCVLVDSVGMFCTRELQSASDGEQKRDPAQVLTSQFIKKIGQLLMPMDTIFLNVLHKYANTNAKFNEKKTVIAGGSKVAFENLAAIDATYSKKAPMDNEKDVSDGQMIFLKCINSELGPRHVEAEAYLLFGQGLWSSYELLSLVTQPGVDGCYGVTSKAGGYFTFDASVAGATVKLRNAKKTAAWLDENPKVYQAIYNMYKDAQWPNTKLYEKPTKK